MKVNKFKKYYVAENEKLDFNID